MAEFNSRKHSIPEPSDHQNSAQLFRQFSNSVHDFIPVESESERNQILIELRGEGYEGPVYIDRSDIGTWERYPGTNDILQQGWEVMGGRQHGATVYLGRNDASAGGVRVLSITQLRRASVGFTVPTEYDIAVPMTGMYGFSVSGTRDGAASSLGRVFFELVLNNTEPPIMRWSSENEDWNGGAIFHPLTEGDRLRVRSYHQSGGTRKIEATFQIAQLANPRW